MNALLSQNSRSASVLNEHLFSLPKQICINNNIKQRIYIATRLPPTQVTSYTRVSQAIRWTHHITEAQSGKTVPGLADAFDMPANVSFDP